MNQAMHERLSALSDGELQGDDVRFLLRGIAGTPGPRALWGRYHLVRVCMRRGDFSLPRAGFADAVLARLDAEARPQRARAWLRTAAGGLIAAGVAAVALVAIAPSGVEAPAVTVAATPALTGNTGLRTEDLRPQIPARTASAGSMLGPVLPPAASLAGEDELDAYLIHHGDAAYGTGRYAQAPYVYVIAGPAPARVATVATSDAADSTAPER